MCGYIACAFIFARLLKSAVDASKAQGQPLAPVLTLLNAGVGSNTVVEHCEVAFNADDGFEFFGGTVNVKYLSALFVKDDAFDTDHGYQGKGQFLFIMEGSEGDHSFEMDSSYSSRDDQPRSHPQFYSVTALGGGTGGDVRGGELMHVNDGTGGSFQNLLLINPAGNGVKFDDCGTETYTQVDLTSSSGPALLFPPKRDPRNPPSVPASLDRIGVEIDSYPEVET